MEEVLTEEYPEQHIVDSWKNEIRTLAHAHAEREPTKYIVDKFFSLGSLNILYGAPAVMKSMLLADLCAAIVAGDDWLPGCNGTSDGIQTEQMPILWIDMDNGKRRTDERFDALSRAREMSDDEPLYYLSMPRNPLELTNDDAIAALIRLARDDYKAGMIVIDNLGVVTGEIEENSAGMAQVMSYLRILAESTNSAVVVIHHQRKGGANQGRAGDALRGHSSIEASLDLALHVTREPGSLDLTIQSTKTRGVDVPTVAARFNFEHKPGTNDLALAWFDGVKEVRGDNPVKDAVIYILEGHQKGITKGRLADLVYDNLNREIGINKIRNWISDMVAVTGEVVEKKGDRGAKILVLEQSKRFT